MALISRISHDSAGVYNHKGRRAKRATTRFLHFPPKLQATTHLIV